MSTVEEQARALVRDLAPGPFQKIAGWGHAIPAAEREAIIAVARGYSAGHEAATRTREVTTVAELDDLPVGSVVLCRDGQVREVMHSRRSGEMHGALRAFNGGYLVHESRLTQVLPVRVLHTP